MITQELIDHYRTMANIGLRNGEDDVKSKVVRDLCDEVEELQRQLSESRADYYETLIDMVRQNCGMDDGTYQHFFMSTYEAAFRDLTAAGIMRQVDRVNWVFVADAQEK